MFAHDESPQVRLVVAGDQRGVERVGGGRSTSAVRKRIPHFARTTAGGRERTAGDRRQSVGACAHVDERGEEQAVERSCRGRGESQLPERGAPFARGGIDLGRPRASVAGCPTTHPAILTNLCGDDSAPVRLALVGNPSTPAPIIDDFLRNDTPWTTPVGSTSPADRIAAAADPSPSRWIRGLAAGNPKATPEALRRISHGLVAPPWVLGAVARNPACPADLADELLTWLALGGAGTGSATFDPRTCLDNPLDRELNAQSYFGAIAGNTSRESRDPACAVAGSSGIHESEQGALPAPRLPLP